MPIVWNLQSSPITMNHHEITALQLRIGVEPDGFWGPRSIAACQKHLRVLMPRVSPWPKADEASLVKFYGKAGDENNLVDFQFPDGWRLYGDKPISQHRCHKKVAASLQRILKRITNHVVCYDGCFNYRPMRGGSRLSTHAWGIAVDLDAAANGNRSHWPLSSKMPIEVMEEFAREGWLPAGAFWSRDAMHFQATQ